MNKLIGIGKVQNGRMMFSTVDGNGFSRPVKRTSVEGASIKGGPVEGPSVQEEQKEEIDIMFDFVHERKPIVSKSNVIHVQFSQETPKSIDDKIEEVIDGFINKTKKGTKKIFRPLEKFFFPEVHRKEDDK